MNDRVVTIAIHRGRRFGCSGAPVRLQENRHAGLDDFIGKRSSRIALTSPAARRADSY